LKARPVLYVLAGVNGAGKSSVGGYMLEQAGLAWFNPDTFAHELRSRIRCSQLEANALAWQEGMRRFDAAIAERKNYAFETTLGGNTVPAKIKAAAQTHDVLMWFCGLDSPERHIARVKARVASGGHDIAAAKIRERYPVALENLIALMPCLAHLQVYDNSAEAGRNRVIADPMRVAEIVAGKLTSPMGIKALKRTPDWAKPIVEAALSLI
jgi:predicted ABC-type ATPase